MHQQKSCFNVNVANALSCNVKSDLSKSLEDSGEQIQTNKGSTLKKEIAASSNTALKNEKELKILQKKPINLVNGPYNWQATTNTLKERFSFLLASDVMSDVTFVVGRAGSQQRIPAHRFMLATGSAVFYAMLYGQLEEHNKSEIHLTDVEPEAFLALLRFLYTDDVQIGPETVMTVLYTAKKYAIPALEKHCVEFLKKHLAPDNVFMLLIQASLFDEPQLATLCLEMIDKHTEESTSFDGFLEVDAQTLATVLRRDTLRIREARLFEVVVKWAKLQCVSQSLEPTGENCRTALGEVLRLVRFPLMTVDEFAHGPAQTKILTDSEVVQLFLYFTVNPKPSVLFPDVPRCCLPGKEQTITRFQQTEARWGYSGTGDKIRFSVDRRIFVVGFGMYGSFNGPAEYEINIQIVHTGTGKVCATNDTSLASDGTANAFRVMFKEPVEVMTNACYTAEATLKGMDSHYGCRGMRSVTVPCPAGEGVTFQFTYATGNNNGTSVEDGQIPQIIFYV